MEYYRFVPTNLSPRIDNARHAPRNRLASGSWCFFFLFHDEPYATPYRLVRWSCFHEIKLYRINLFVIESNTYVRVET